MIAETFWLSVWAARRALDKARGAARQAPRWWRYWNSYRRYNRMAGPADRPDARRQVPCIDDATDTTPIEPIYFYQDSWAFERIVAQRPPRHVDVGSNHKFVALLSKVVPVTMVDLRPLALPMESIAFERGTILALPFDSASVPSLSSLCVVEHIGLGRYGDPLDPRGTEKAIAELKRVVAPGGRLYLSLPLDDRDRVYFNAHRALTEARVLELVRPFEIANRRYIYGNEYLEAPGRGFGVGCYELVAPR